MREIRLSGSVRGVRSDPYPYRDTFHPLRSSATESASESDLGRRDEMEQPVRHSGNRIGCRLALPAALARRVGKHDAPALFWGIA